MVQGGMFLGGPEEHERDVPPDIDELANRLAWKHSDDVADRYRLDDEFHPPAKPTDTIKDRIAGEPELHFAIRAAIWSAIVEAFYERSKITDRLPP